MHGFTLKDDKFEHYTTCMLSFVLKQIDQDFQLIKGPFDIF